MGVGAVAELWRYPVKSMAGRRLDAAAVTEGGLAGDRAFALIDRETGKLASAKLPRKWASLLDCRVDFADESTDGGHAPLQFTLPGGESFRSDDEDAETLLSQALGRPVRLAGTLPEGTVVEYVSDPLGDPETVTEFPPGWAAPEGAFFDYAPVHLLTTASLDRLQELYPDGRFEVARFRPNIVVQPDASTAGFVENDWVGRTLAIGSEVQLRIIDPAPRCVMTTMAQGDLPADAGILRTVAQHNLARFSPSDAAMPCVGVYAAVLRGGTVRNGDSVTLAD